MRTRQARSKAYFGCYGAVPSGDFKKYGPHYDNPDILAEVSRSLGEAMVGINIPDLKEEELLASRGW